MKVSESKRKLFKSLLECPVITHENFCLYKSGYSGEDFFDIDLLMGRPDKQDEVLGEYSKQIEDLSRDFDKFGFMDKGPGPTGILSIAYGICQRYGKEMVVVRLREEYRLPHLKVKGFIKNEGEYPLKKGDRVLLLDDVCTQGNTVRQAIDIMENHPFDADVVGLITAFNRNPKIIEKIAKDYDLEVRSIWTRDELVNLGYMLPTTQELEKDDFVDRIVTQVYGDELPPDELTVKKNHLNEALDNGIKEMLSEYNIKTDKQGFQNIKNIYLMFAMNAVHAAHQS